LNGQREKGGWVKVPAIVKPGQSGAAVSALRQRLAMSGHLKGPAIGEQGGSNYDADLQAAVKSFQELHSIAATGIVDEKTLSAECPLDWRIQQVALNLALALHAG
jgi:murein L,D-transpeptidase YcbB/YkuD